MQSILIALTLLHPVPSGIISLKAVFVPQVLDAEG